MASNDSYKLLYWVAGASITIMTLGVKALLRWQRNETARSWITLDGHIETHDWQPSTNIKGRSHFDVAIGYSYEYQGEFYSGLHQLGTTDSTEDADTKCQGYPIGMPVKVRVNPDHPDQSVLNTV